jgi:hypothetical protein
MGHVVAQGGCDGVTYFVVESRVSALVTHLAKTNYYQSPYS